MSGYQPTNTGTTLPPPPAARRAPRRAVVFKLEAQADTLDDLSNLLFNLHIRVLDDLGEHSVSGGYSSGYEHWLTVANRPTHDEYCQQINEYLADTAAKRATP